MSTISTEERRDVARRLRKAIGLTEFAEVLGFNWTDDSDWGWKDVSSLVADLIDPECRHEEFCRVCGHVIPDGWSECPRCRSKVVRDDN